MGTIDQLIINSGGTIREAVVRLPSHRLIRRPVNLLIPLELHEDPSRRRNIRNSLRLNKETPKNIDSH